MFLVPAQQLGQVRLTSSGVASALVSGAELAVEVTRIQIVNNGANTVTVELYHDDDGTTYDATSKIRTYYLTATGAAGDMAELAAQIPGGGISISPDGNLAVEATGTSPDVTVTAYGITDSSNRQ